MQIKTILHDKGGVLILDKPGGQRRVMAASATLNRRRSQEWNMPASRAPWRTKARPPRMTPSAGLCRYDTPQT